MIRVFTTTWELELKPSLFAQYKKERENVETIEVDGGFATYSIGPDFVYLEDVFIVPEKRQTGLGRKFVDDVSKIGKENGLTKIITSACITTKGASTSIKAIISCGFEPFKLDGSMIYFEKEIK